MRTRTLLLLAVSCGLVILVAGTIQLLRISNQKTTAALAVGDTGTAGDAVVTVDAISERDGLMVVSVTLSGVDDPDGLDGFTLVGVDAVSKPANGTAGDTTPDDTTADDTTADECTGFTVAPVECTLTFVTDGFITSQRQLLFLRAEERVRWNLV